MSILKFMFKQDKEKELFEELVSGEQEKLYKVAYSYVRNEQDALDIVQETIIKGYRSFTKLNDRSFFSTWMTRILINTALDFIRKSKDVIYLETECLETGTNEESISVMKMDLSAIYSQSCIEANSGSYSFEVK